MRYGTEHKANTRKRLLEAAGTLAKQDGFAATGVDALTAAAGLTSGAFYAHFASKDEMLAALVDSELGRSLRLFAGGSDAELHAALDAYLGAGHVENPGRGCAVPALVADIARASPDARQAFERRLGEIRQALAPHCRDDRDAWVLIAELVGAVAIARALATGEARAALLGAVRRHAQGLVGTPRAAGPRR